MKKALCIILFHALVISLKAQTNLVPNYSFEQKVKCINYFDEFDGYILYWTGQGAFPGGGLSWMTSQCDSGGYAWVPQNVQGFQYARTGNSYAGVTLFISSYACTIEGHSASECQNLRNYIEVPLNEPLTANNTYCVTFYVSLSDTSKYACNDIGAYLSDSLLYEDPNDAVKNYIIPQIANDPINNPLTNKVKWIKVQGDFVAKGGEKYIVIGNFKDDAHSSIDSVGSNASNNKPGADDPFAAFYYIDDVYLHTPVLANAGNDTTLCNGGHLLIGRDTAQTGVSYYWQPTTGLANPNAAQTIASPTVTTTYTLTVVNDSMQSCGCNMSINSSSVTIEVCPESIYIPTAFSPNNDGQNDIFLIKGDFINTIKIQIYDRWGEKVFESENINEGWDGKYQGQPENTGTYVYYLEGTYTNGNNFNKKGNVVLVR